MMPTFTSCISRYYAGSAVSPSERGEHLRDGVPAIVPYGHANAGVGEFSGQDVLAVAGALHPAPNGRLHRISLAIFFENVFTAPPPGDSGRAKAIVWASELGILVREKSFGDHALAVRSRDIGDLRTPFQGRQSIFLANLIDRLENALLDGLRMLRIARDEHEKRNEGNPNHGLESRKHSGTM
jgi:hypothetical protein